MLLEFYLWLWPQMRWRYLIKRSSYLLGLAILLIGPLLYMNIDLIRQGFKPSQAGFSIEADNGSHAYSGTYSLPDDE